MAEALYVKHSDLMYLRGDIGLQLSRAADNVVPACCDGAQKLRGVWHIFINNDNSRAALLNSVFSVCNKTITLLNTHPFANLRPTDGPPLEKIVFKDIPLNDATGNDLISSYLRDRPYVKVVSDVTYAK